MGKHLNPGNKGFREILNGEYVDKTGLIDLVNRTVGSPEKLTCVSRPRRFGKSFAAKMLCAYYDFSCDSRGLFDDKEIAGKEGYLEHLNRYHVVNLDITEFIADAAEADAPLTDVPKMISAAICKELAQPHPELHGESLRDAVISCVEKTGREFIFVIDEWDALIREAKGDQAAQKAYLDFLRSLFKNSSFTPYAIAAAYMTGILPIKKDGSQSAISDFKEYSILRPGRFAEYMGFTESEVRGLCGKYGMDFEEVRRWYDGYDFSKYEPVYNPYAVMCAMQEQEYRSYWRMTSAAESLMTYINMDFEGMREVVSRLIVGEEAAVDTESFENDFETFENRDDVLTLLIHMGYLTWNEKEHTARIPNEEVRGEFRNILKGRKVSSKWVELIERSKKLLNDTIAGNAEAVAKAMEEIRDTEYAPTYYNNEQSLRYAVKFAYIAALDEYLKIEELPSGKGIADIVYIPRKGSMKPALVIELKWNKSAEGAVRQIKGRNYPAILKGYEGAVVLVGITYDARTKKHGCVIG